MTQTHVASSKGSCTFCRTSSHRLRCKGLDDAGREFRYWDCDHCGCVFLWPRPSGEALQAVYDASYYGEEDSKFHPWLERIVARFRRSRARRVLRFCVMPARVLDIGCGNGEFLGHLMAVGCQGFGQELPGKAAERAGRIAGLNLKMGALKSGDYPLNHFDLVTLWHVFEHLENPAETLAEIDRILKPEGFLIMSFPNVDSWQSSWFGAHWFHLDPPRHLFFPRPERLIRHLATLDFDCVRQTHFSLEQNPFGFQQSLLNRWVQPRDALYSALRTARRGGRPASLIWQRAFFFVTFPFFVGLAALEALMRRGGTVELVFQKRQKNFTVSSPQGVSGHV